MNHYFPDWDVDGELPGVSQRKPLGLDQELVELLWENGQVVLNSQTHRKPGLDPNESRQVGKYNQLSIHVEGSSAVNPPELAQDNEPVSWDHCQVDDPFEKELSSFLLPEFPPVPNSDLLHDTPFHQLDSHKFCNTDGSQISHLMPYPGHSENFCANSAQPTRFQALHSNDANLGDIVHNNQRAFSNPCTSLNRGGFGGEGDCNMRMREVRASSGKTVGSSHCGSNQVIYDAGTSLASCSGIGRKPPKTAADVEDNGGKVASQSEMSTERETVISLSSGGSGFASIGGTCDQSIGTHSHKRKSRETENSESQSEAALLESATNKKSGTTRKSRAAEVHNLSERRRRDRINEKMRALQELLPRSNQSDKASMLDDAIQYMKSLQLQLQIMWMGMGSRMAPLVFSGVAPPYASRLEFGIGPPVLPSVQSAMNLSRLQMMDQAKAVAPMPMPNQAAVPQSTLLNSINHQNPNCNFSDQCGSYIGFFPFQGANQPLNLFTCGCNMAHQNKPLLPGDGNGPSA